MHKEGEAMNQFWTASEMAQKIITQNAMDIEDLGNLAAQKATIYGYINLALWELARLAFRLVYSDEIEIDADGFVTFTQSGSPITNMFEPQTIYMPSGQPMMKRSADEAPLGWWREAETQDIHVRGFGISNNTKLVSGLYKLKYLRYPNPVTVDTDYPDFPPSGYGAIINNVSARIKYSKNSFSDAQYFEAQAKSSYANLAQGSISARGTGTTGQPLGDNDVSKARGN